MAPIITGAPEATSITIDPADDWDNAYIAILRK